MTAETNKAETDGFVLFADETGLDQVMACRGDVRCVAMVVDPKRPAAVSAARQLAGDAPLLLHPLKAERERFERTLAAARPRFGVVCSYSRILWQELLALFPAGSVNVHGGPLPRYRGANVLQWVIINGEAETAVTLHYVDAGVDTGPIIDQVAVSIAESDTALTLRDRLGMATAELLHRWMPRLADGPLPAEPQDERLARAWPRRKPEDGRVDWAMSDAQISRLSRALVSPWPGIRIGTGDGQDIVIDRALSDAEVLSLRGLYAR